jgi:ribosomal protein S12
MPTKQQLKREKEKQVHKSPALKGCPQRLGTCTRVYATASDHEFEVIIQYKGPDR